MTPDEAAQWMLEKLNKWKSLEQEAVAWELESRDRSLIYETEAGNIGIAKAVLDAFRKLTGDTVVYSRGEKTWRFREDFDVPGKRQQDW